MKHALACLPLSLLVLAAFSAPVRAADNEDARLTEFFKAYLEKAFRLRPSEATRLGDHRFDHLLDDISAKARAGWTAQYRHTLADLPKQIDRAKLSRSAQIDYDIFKHKQDRCEKVVLTP